jgi:hypothetical protein
MTPNLAAARVVRTAVVTVGNAVAIAIARDALARRLPLAFAMSDGSALPLAIPVAVLIRVMPVASFHGVSDTARKTADGDQRYSKPLHSFLLARKRRRTH